MPCKCLSSFLDPVQLYLGASGICFAAPVEKVGIFIASHKSGAHHVDKLRRSRISYIYYIIHLRAMTCSLVNGNFGAESAF